MNKENLKKMRIKNPFNNDVVGEILLKTESEIDILLKKAYNFKYKENSKDRAKILNNVAQFYDDNSFTEALLITKESGICIKQALYEVKRSVNALKYAAMHAEKLDSNDISSDYIMNSDNSNVDLEVIVEPFDLAIAITPFNHPLNQVVHKVAPAIAAGTAIVLKPSEKTPLSAYRFREVLTECGLPDYAFIVLNGLDLVHTVTQLVSYSNLDVVSFTGSVEVGKKIEAIMKDNGNTLKKYIPELGGNAAFVINEDADLELASNIALSAFDNAGQRCTAIKRILVHNQVADKFIEKFISKVKDIKYGDPFDENNTMGTLIDSKAVEQIYNRVNSAIDSGAKLLYGNQTSKAVYSPTVIDSVLPEMELVKEETFGPIAPIIRFNSIDECVEIVKSTSFRLAGSIATKSLETAKEYSNRISVGQFSWNGPPGYRTENAPFGGFGSSGNGAKEGIVHSIKGLMKIRTFWRHN